MELRVLVGSSPRLRGKAQTRWTAAAIGDCCHWLQGKSRSQIGRVLRAFGIRRVLSRDHVHSPDPAYDQKRAAVQAAIAAADPHHIVCFLDEVTIYRQPTAAPDYVDATCRQPLAERSHGSNQGERIIAALNAATGQVTWLRRRTTNLAVIVEFYQALVAAYPDATQITVVLDNWPVHFHPDVLIALQPQPTTFPFPRPRSWKTEAKPSAREAWTRLALPIRLLPLPTYASWLNPIEKLWRWLRQDVTHRHPWADRLGELWTTIDAFLDRFTRPSPDLLRYVGLESPD